MKSLLRSFFCALVSFLSTSAAHAASMDDVTPQLKRDAECMLRVLKSVPGIDGTEMGVSDLGGWSHPFLQYRAAPARDGYRATIRFDATKNFQSNDRKSTFEAMIPGIYGQNESGPPDYGTGALAKLWEKKCTVRVMVLSV
jgi:hypothetical protein